MNFTDFFGALLWPMSCNPERYKGCRALDQSGQGFPHVGPRIWFFQFWSLCSMYAFYWTVTWFPTKNWLTMSWTCSYPTLSVRSSWSSTGFTLIRSGPCIKTSLTDAATTLICCTGSRIQESPSHNLEFEVPHRINLSSSLLSDKLVIPGAGSHWYRPLWNSRSIHVITHTRCTHTCTTWFCIIFTPECCVWIFIKE